MSAPPTRQDFRRMRIFLAACVFFPWILIGLELVVLMFVQSQGCSVSSRGPEPCIIFGRDVGDALTGLSSIGYHIAFSFLWVLPGLLIWGLIEMLATLRNR